MRNSYDRRPRAVPLLVALLALCLLGARPAVASDGPSIGPEVARLYQEASRAVASYERGRRAAEAQRVKAAALERRLTGHRRELAALHERVGGVARAQYREGGSLTHTARLLLARDPDQLMRGQQLAAQAEAAVSRLLDSSRRAEARLAVAEGAANSARHELDLRVARLDRIKQGIATRLEEAQWRLQAEANRSAAAGSCRGAVRIEQPGGPPPGARWVAPVAAYALSAGFDSAGERWARRHTGQDFAVPIGTPVRAVGAGRVVRVSCGGGFGIEVVVGHDDGWYSQYAHLASAAVEAGERVRPGQWIGQAGTTGNSTGPHLHFETRLTPHLGSGVDPARWLAERGVRLRAVVPPGEEPEAAGGTVPDATGGTVPDAVRGPLPGAPGQDGRFPAPAPAPGAPAPVPVPDAPPVPAPDAVVGGPGAVPGP
ncbi:peptidoglycan DD-metalloendopeptidase family protein [Streptomyces tritici]|uniref:M23 family metallopeptidase n=1 Tax=Streptomyces tritici TaxID=2054410 RepID=UPI003AF114CE